MIIIPLIPLSPLTRGQFDKVLHRYWRLGLAGRLEGSHDGCGFDSLHQRVADEDVDVPRVVSLLARPLVGLPVLRSLDLDNPSPAGSRGLDITDIPAHLFINHSLSCAVQCSQGMAFLISETHLGRSIHSNNVGWNVLGCWKSSFSISNNLRAKWMSSLLLWEL